jgi:hypothetical protein
MPDFGIAFDGAPLAPWLDPPTGELPSRINPTPTHPHLRRLATVGQEVELAAVVAGVTGPLDGALGGRLFVGWFIEHPTVEPPAVASPAGQSSVCRFTPPLPGHYTYCLRRDGGGGLILHVDAL